MDSPTACRDGGALRRSRCLGLQLRQLAVQRLKPDHPHTRFPGSSASLHRGGESPPFRRAFRAKSRCSAASPIFLRDQLNPQARTPPCVAQLTEFSEALRARGAPLVGGWPALASGAAPRRLPAKSEMPLRRASIRRIGILMLHVAYSTCCSSARPAPEVAMPTHYARHTTLTIASVHNANSANTRTRAQREPPGHAMASRNRAGARSRRTRLP